MSNPKILLMEDEADLARIFQRKLSREGYQVAIAGDGFRGLEMLQEEAYDLLLVDYKMPRADGLRVLDLLSKEENAPPAIMLSGVSNFEVVVEAMKLGAADYVIKDFQDDTFSLLLRAIERTLEHAQLRKDLIQSNIRLRASEEMFRALTENTSDITLVLDREHHLIYATPFFEKFSGKAFKEIEKGSLRQFLYDRDMATLRASAEIAWENPGETVVTPDFRCYDVHGHLRHFSARLTALPETPGIQGLVVNCRDITGRKRAEKDLQKEKMRAEQYLHTAGSLILALGPSGDVRLINRQACRVLGYSEEEIQGGMWSELCLAPTARESFSRLFTRLFEESLMEIDQLELTVITKEGEERVISWSVQPLKKGKWVVQILLSGIDVTERKRAEAALAKSDERYALATRAAKVGVWDWDLLTQEMFIDPHLKEALGFTEEEMPNEPEAWRNQLHEDDRKNVWHSIERCLHQDQDYCEVEHRMVCKNGSVRWFITRAQAARDALGKVVRLTGTDTDITDLKQAEMHIEHMATHDFLTGLPNRLLLLDRLRVGLANARRTSDIVAVLFLDLDGFKPINDAWGHDSGDEVLQLVAHRLQATFRASDTVARFGGDEFIATFAGMGDLDAASLMAHKVLAAISEPMTIGEERHQVSVSGSIGIALFPFDGEVPEQLVKAADDAMYIAKRAGKKQFAFARQRSHYDFSTIKTSTAKNR